MFNLDVYRFVYGLKIVQVRLWIEDRLWENKSNIDIYHSKGILYVHNSDQLHTLQVCMSSNTLTKNNIKSLLTFAVCSNRVELSLIHLMDTIFIYKFRFYTAGQTRDLFVLYTCFYGCEHMYMFLWLKIYARDYIMVSILIRCLNE